MNVQVNKMQFRHKYLYKIFGKATKSLLLELEYEWKTSAGMD